MNQQCLVFIYNESRISVGNCLYKNTKITNVEVMFFCTKVINIKKQCLLKCYIKLYVFVVVEALSLMETKKKV